MRLLSPALLLVIFCGGHAALPAQTSTGTPPETMQPSKTPSAIMQPALDNLQQTLGMLRPDKWKISGAAREETAANISSIGQDLETTLPPLLTSADGAPGSVAQVLPAYRNIEALYDVLLRVTAAANLSAPGQQSAALDDARARLEEGRRALGERLQSAALVQEKQVHDLQAAVRAIPPPAPAPAACPPPPAVKKRKPRRKPATRPVTPPANPNPQNGVSPSH